MNKSNEIPSIVEQNKEIEGKIDNQFINPLDYQNYNQDLTILSTHLRWDLSNQELVFILNEVHDKIKTLDTKLDRQILTTLRKIEAGNLSPVDIQNEINTLQNNISTAKAEIRNITNTYNNDKSDIQNRTNQYLVHQKNLTEMSDSELDNYLLALSQGIQYQKEAILTKADRLKNDDAEYWDEWLESWFSEEDFMKHKDDIEMAQEMMHDAVLKTVGELTNFASDRNSLRLDLSTIDQSLSGEVWEFANQADKLLYVKQALDTLNAWLNEHDSQWIDGIISWGSSVVILWSCFVVIHKILGKLSPIWLIVKWVSWVNEKRKWSSKNQSKNNTSTESSNTDSEKTSTGEKVSEVNEKISKEKMLNYIEKVEKKVSWDVDKMKNLFSLKKLVSAWNLNWFPESSFWEILHKIENWSWDINFAKKLRIKLADWTLTKKPINWWKELIKWDTNQLLYLNYLKEFDTPETKVTLLWEEYKIPEKYKAEVQELAKQLDDMDRISRIEAEVQSIKNPELTRLRAEMGRLTLERGRISSHISSLDKRINNWTARQPNWVANPDYIEADNNLKEIEKQMTNIGEKQTTLIKEIDTAQIEIDRLSDIHQNIDDQFDDIFRKKWIAPTISKLNGDDIRKIDTRRKFIQSLIKAIK